MARQTGALRNVLRSLVSDLHLVREAFETPNAQPYCDGPHRHNREWCVIYLNDSWHRFCRQLVIASAVCEPLTLSGLQVPQVPGLGSEQDVLARLRTMPGRPRPR